MLRVPAKRVDGKVLRAYFVGDAANAKAAGEHLIIDLHSEDEEGSKTPSRRRSSTSASRVPCGQDVVLVVDGLCNSSGLMGARGRRRYSRTWRLLLFADGSTRSTGPRPSMTYQNHIARDPKVCGGQPVVRGTRVPLRVVLAHLAHGETVEHIVMEFPTVTAEDVRAVIAFAAASVAEDLPAPSPIPPDVKVA